METSDHSKQGINIDDVGGASLKLFQGLSNGIELISLLTSSIRAKVTAWGDFRFQLPEFCMLSQASFASMQDAIA